MLTEKAELNVTKIEQQKEADRGRGNRENEMKMKINKKG
jgi:hypothetical protein